MKRPATRLSLLALLALFGAGYSVVRPTNFSGWDEWLVIDLTARGIVSLPYENRPFSLLFNLPGSLLARHGLVGFWLVHGFYLWTVAAAVLLVARRLAPGRGLLAFTAAAFAVSWAPLDVMRLDPVLIANYSGAAAASCVAILLLVEAWRHRSWVLLAAGAALAFVAVRALESTAGLIVAGPLMLWALPEAVDPGSRRCRVWFSSVWLGVASVAVALAAAPLLPGRQASYQVSGLGFDPQPAHVLVRLARQLWFQLGPLFSPAAAELLDARVAVAVAVFVVAAWCLGRREPADARPRQATALRVAVVGLAAAILGHAVLALSRAIVGPQRMQILSAPGIGLLLAASLELLAAPLRRHLRVAAVVTLGAYMVALGTGRTVAMQRDWGRLSLWPAQSASLVGLTRAAPALAPGTLLLLVDECEAWPASFSFRHAVRYLYGAGVVGVVWGAESFLYPIHRVATGFVSEPYESIRHAWHVSVTYHRFDQTVVARCRREGQVDVLDEWPAGILGPLPVGAGYAPRGRIGAVGDRPERRVLPRADHAARSFLVRPVRELRGAPDRIVARPGAVQRGGTG